MTPESKLDSPTENQTSPEQNNQSKRFKTKLIKKEIEFSAKGVFVFAVVFALIGGFVVWKSFAASPPPNIQISGVNQTKIKPQSPHSLNQLLVRFKAGAPVSLQKSLIARYKSNITREIPNIGVKVIKVPAKSLDAVKTALSHNPAIDFAEYDGVDSALTVPNDPYYTNQWFLNKIKAPSAWDVTHGNSSTIVAILDTGISTTHPDLAGKVVATQKYSSSATADDTNGHGTHSAGVASADTDNSTGVAGLGYSISLQNVKVLGDSGSGLYSDTISGITWAADHGAKVINISLGGTLDSASMHSAVDYAWSKGAVIVAAAGNSASSSPFYPAAYPSVIAVAATTDLDRLASFSNYGDWVDVAAPGISIYSTGIVSGTPGYDYQSGTSFSSPLTAGLAGLLFSKVTDANKNGFLNDDVRARLQSTADNIGIASVGSGRINAYNAVTVSSPAPTTDTTAPTTAITSPTASSTVSGAVSINANASDNVGVSKVEFYLDGSLKASVGYNPYSYYWDTTTVANGSHILATKAYDAAGNIGTSANVTVTVSNITPDTTPPNASISNPANGTTLSGQVNIASSASDNVGVTSSELYIDGLLRASSTSASMSFSWNTGAETNGNHSLVVKAYDAAGNAGTSVTVTVNVSNQSDILAPIATITSPPNGSVVSIRGTTSIKSSATDNVGVTKMEVYIDGSLKATSTSGLISYSWNPKKASLGVHTVVVKAYDAAGNVGQAQISLAK